MVGTGGPCRGLWRLAMVASSGAPAGDSALLLGLSNEATFSANAVDEVHKGAPWPFALSASDREQGDFQQAIAKLEAAFA